MSPTTEAEQAPDETASEASRFSVVEPEVQQALRAAHAVPEGGWLLVFGHLVADQATDSGCPTEILSTTYVGSDGHTHVSVATWDSCTKHLEILADVVVPDP